jgi:DNA-binding response OmpR family regulator
VNEARGTVMTPGGPQAVKSFNFDGASVAIVEASSLCMELLTNILRGFGFRTNHRCLDLATATDVVKSHAVDLLLIDPFHYGEPAYDFIRWLRSERRGRSSSAVVMIVTARTSIKVISAARNCGADFVLAKPFSVSTLLDRILWVANSEGRRGELIAPADVVSTSGSGVELW